MRSPIITDTGAWCVERWLFREHDDPDLPSMAELRTATGLMAFLQRGHDAAKKMRESAEEAGYTVLEDPEFHVFLDSVMLYNRPLIACSARVISRESGITALPERTSPTRV